MKQRSGFELLLHTPYRKTICEVYFIYTFDPSSTIEVCFK